MNVYVWAHKHVPHVSATESSEAEIADVCKLLDLSGRN